MSVSEVQAGTGAHLWYDSLWDDLLDFVDAGQVVPIIGPDLVRLEDHDSLPLDQVLARRFVQEIHNEFGATVDRLPADASLDEAIAFARRQHISNIPGRLSRIYQKAALKPPPILQQLAAITKFNLFVTTTCDSLLEDAINQVRFGGRAVTESKAYAPNNSEDNDLGRTGGGVTVYHLFGKFHPISPFAASEEDVLEFITGLQSNRPRNLFDRLRTSNLLLLGGNFPDWLARFVLRLTKNERLSAERSMNNLNLLEFVADDTARSDPRLTAFLQNFSPSTHVFQGTGADFVAELSRRSQGRAGTDMPTATPNVGPPAEMPKNGIFISYASEDAAAAREMASRLGEAGLGYWYDKEQLKSGHDWQIEIQKNVQRCGLFMPLISRNTESQSESYFRVEWDYAVERSRSIDPSRAFIVPVIIDDTAEPQRVPERFTRKQFNFAPGGRATPDTVKYWKGLIEG